MTVCKRTLLILLLLISLVFTGYQVFLTVQPLFAYDADTYYVRLVDQYQIFKMERLALEERYALERTQHQLQALRESNKKKGQFAFNFHREDKHNTYLPQQSIAFQDNNSDREQPIALSLEESKTFEQLEAYVSNNKPPQPQPLTKDEELILKSPSDNFTLQLMGVRDANELRHFVNENQLHNAHIIHTYYLNKDWYVLVSGSYKNHTEALKAIDTLPSPIKELKPWIRQLASLQKAIQIYRN